MKHKVRRRRRLRIARFFTHIILWAIALMFLSKSEITLNYNKTKAMKARRTFLGMVWDRTMKIARGVGDIRYAIWR